MEKVLSKDELILEINKLKKELRLTIESSILREKELNAIMNGAKAVLKQRGFTESARIIFNHCKDLIGATSGYVALLSDNGEENEVLFLESGGLPCDVNPELPMPIRGLRAKAYHTNKSTFHNDFMNSEWVHLMPKGHVILNNVLFAPLVLEGKTVGIIGLANKPSGFHKNDAKMAVRFGKLAAIALQNSQYVDKKVKAEQEREKVIEELKDALSKVKKLRGLLPICSFCKKIRDDKGYYQEVEVYVTEHTEAKFSHGVCPQCESVHYPELSGGS